MKAIITTFLAITTTLSFISAAGQLLVKERKLMNYTLSTFFFFLTIIQVQAMAIFTGILFIYPFIFFLHATSLYMLGVIRYFAYFLLSLQDEPVPKYKFLYFLPSIIAFIFDLYYMSLPDTEKFILVKNIFSGTLTEYNALPRFLLAGAGFQAAIYWSVLLVKLLKTRKNDKKVVLPKTSITYTVIAIFIFIILAGGYLFALIDIFIIISTILGILIIGTFLISQMSPELLQITMLSKTKKRYSHSHLMHVKTDELHRRIIELVDEKKIYTDPNITLLDCADELFITPHQLSEFLNNQLNCNFNTFINQYRVKEAGRLLVANPKQTNLAIARAVGFNSKSSFYDSFSRHTGMTPYQYKKKHQKK